MRVLVTRPQGEAGKLIDALRAKGYDATALPLIAVAGAPEPLHLLEAWAGLPGYDAVMFVSANAVHHFFAARPAQSPLFTAHSPVPLRAYVTGPGSRSALARAGVDPQWIDGPDADGQQFDSEALWAVISHRVVPGFRVLIVRGTDGGNALDGEGRDWLGAQVRAAGGRVDYVVAYQRQLPAWTPAQAALAAQAGTDGSVWVFSSSQAIRNLRVLCPQQTWGHACAIVTHARIAQTARGAGFGSVWESGPSVARLIASIESLQ